MQDSLSSTDKFWPRILNFIFGLGMMGASFLTMRHFFLVNYPTPIYEGSFCDINSFFNCNSSAYSAIFQLAEVPLGYFGLILGGWFLWEACFLRQALSEPIRYSLY